MKTSLAREIVEGGEAAEGGFFSISPATLFENAAGAFEVYVRRSGRYVLFLNGNERFTALHARALKMGGVRQVFVRHEQAGLYDGYLESRLSGILADRRLPLGERARALYHASTSIVRDVFDRKLPSGLGGREYHRIEALVMKSAAHLCDERSLARLASLIGHDYSIYSHSVQVFVYAATLLRVLGQTEAEIVPAGVGALLHDVGKQGIDPAILNKPGPLTPEERLHVMTHPAKGAAYCANMPLAPAAAACILLHHERMDGTGYPGGLPGERIPLQVRALTIADIYDALTSKRPYAAAMTPYEALRLMRDEMRTALDMDLFKRFVVLLSGADLV